MGGTIKKFSFFTGELLLSLNNLADGYSCYVMTVSQNDEYIMFGFENGLALFYKKSNDRPFKKFSFEIPINTCAFSSGSTFCAIGLDDGTIFVVSMKSEHIWRQKIHSNPTTSVSFSTYSPLYLISSCIKSGEISFSKFENNIYKVYKKISVPHKCRLVAYSFSYDETIIYGCSRNEIYAWESESGNLIGQLEVKELGIELISVSAHPCCRNLCLVVSKSSISLWNYKTHEYTDLHIVQLGNTLIQSVQWADSLTLYGLFSDGSLKVFSTKSGNWQQQNDNEYIRFINNEGNEWPEILKLYYGKYFIHPFITNMTNVESILLSHLPIHVDDIDPIESDESSDDSY
ncbi:hypothetical protein TVAG_482770 [Trichomonas vaginalis G3]|uniref:Anaphase-promoting complex subunit 4 WD40 domain-containing protein n=1 Tax=Trichomonas vaginalis (strain ATCC PRA-98 / G3) TaxID=412133 RepID=A2FRR2_TRIV3|nr:WD40 repeat-like family [Trichomonas vaginalis G3]EAX92401.1 hypothetical protein TVAG_482770 [Trichomonas vaginalis G3]KAI5551085.1 WD40 repeat-like family [Trichomonas vaginalis G3]|eukprot:XP_001305331.1 hypothetical protein [Trichomonas vaginalis G3]